MKIINYLVIVTFSFLLGVYVCFKNATLTISIDPTVSYLFEKAEIILDINSSFLGGHGLQIYRTYTNKDNSLMVSPNSYRRYWTEESPLEKGVLPASTPKEGQVIDWNPSKGFYWRDN